MTANFSDSKCLTGLDGYQFVRELGRGGMGVVYEAIETELSRRVALKVLPRAAALDERQLARFQNEAQTAARLDHAHIVPVYAVGCKDGIHFYVMKCIHGHSLAQVIGDLQQRAASSPSTRQQPVHGTATQRRDDEDTLAGTNSPSTIGDGQWQSVSSPEFFREAARLGIQAAEALHHAHACGITHGDVKPANLLLDGDGDLWLTDFGLARLTSAWDDNAAIPLGTLRYLSPEQARSEHATIDHRMDVYSLGATLFELIALRPAVSGVNPTEMLNRIAFGAAPSPSEYNPATPVELQVILRRALASDPNDRYATAAELADDLTRFLAGQPVHTASHIEPPLPRRRLLPRPAVTIAAMLITVFFIVLPVATLLPSLLAPKKTTDSALQLTPAELALRDLMTVNETALVELGNRLSRGGEPTGEDRHLLEDGPEVFPIERDRDKLSGGRQYVVFERYPAELALAFFRLGRIQGRLGNVERQRHMLRQSVELFEPLAERAPKLFRIRLAVASMAEAEVHAAAGRNEEARKLGQRAIDLLEAAREKWPENSEYKVTVAFLHTQFGQMLMHLLPPQVVEQHHRTALAILEALAKDPSPPPSVPMLSSHSLQQLLAECRVNLAACLEPSQECRQLLEMARQCLVSQADQKDADAESRTALLAAAERDLGTTRSRLGQRDEAQNHLQSSIELFGNLCSEFPAVVEYQYDLAISENALGLDLKSAGKKAEADVLFRQALERLEGLVNAYPDVANYRHWLAGTINNAIHGDSDDAIARYEQALEHQIIAVQINPEHCQYRRFALIQSNNLAFAFSRLNEPAKAAIHKSNAIEHLKSVIQRGSPRYNDQHTLGHYLADLGVILANDGRDADAAKVYQEAIELQRELVEEFARRSCDLGTLGGVLHNLALHWEDRRETDLARRLIKEAVTLQNEALRSDPNNARFRQFLANHYTSLDRLDGNPRSGQRNSEPGLISWWTGDNTAEDSVGDNHGTLMGGGVTYAPGQIGQAFRFNGIDDRLGISDSPSLELAGTITLEAWVKIDSFPSDDHGEVIFMRADDRLGLDPYELVVAPGGLLRFAVASYTDRVAVEAPAPAGEFMHVAATLDDATGSMKLYKNGVCVAETTTAVRPFANLDPLSNPGVGIGNHGGFFHHLPFHGLIDELKVYDQALTAAEVLASYQAGQGEVPHGGRTHADDG